MATLVVITLVMLSTSNFTIGTEWGGLERSCVMVPPVLLLQMFPAYVVTRLLGEQNILTLTFINSQTITNLALA